MTQKGNASNVKIVIPAFLLGRVNPFRWNRVAVMFIGLSICSANIVAADQCQLSLIGGSVITADVEGQDILWTDVLVTGEMTKRTIAFSNINQLVLSLSPASQQVAEVRHLLSLLESPDYLDRQRAEDELSETEVGGKFKSLIKSQVDHKLYEVRYRVDRILTRLDTDTQQASNEFDKLSLKDGTQLEGDAGDFRLSCTYRGRKMTFARSDIRMILVPSKTTQAEVAESEIKVTMFHDHEGNFYLPNQTHVDFEQAPNGAELAKFSDVSEMYTPIGLRMGAGKKGSVVVSGFPFRFAPLPPAANSVCVYESIGSYSKRFKGIMEISFCMPNQNSVPAGVHEFGVFLGRVNHSRDFIMEAYNADGQLLASVEATDRPCVFAGVKSTEPIVKIRILSNPYLFRIDRIIDEDYAIDDVCFSRPVPVINPSKSETGIVRLNNGDLLKGEEIMVVDQNSISIRLNGGKPFIINRDELESIRFDTVKDVVQDKNQWMAILPDRSVLRVEPGATFKSHKFSNLEFKPNELMALWPSRHLARFPEANDFEVAKKVLVFPTCRIATDDITFSTQGFAWNNSTKLEQPIRTSEEEDADEEDPTPDISSVEYGKTSPEDIPTIWLNPPRSQAPRTGKIRLTDGQQLVLGGQAGFQLTKFQKDSVTVSVAGKETEIPIRQILSITFPTSE